MVISIKLSYIPLLASLLILLCLIIWQNSRGYVPKESYRLIIYTKVRSVIALVGISLFDVTINLTDSLV